MPPPKRGKKERHCLKSPEGRKGKGEEGVSTHTKKEKFHHLGGEKGKKERKKTLSCHVTQKEKKKKCQVELDQESRKGIVPHLHIIREGKKGRKAPMHVIGKEGKGRKRLVINLSLFMPFQRKEEEGKGGWNLV